jgi:cbb3-type cytochrome c oxidase subunit III
MKHSLMAVLSVAALTGVAASASSQELSAATQAAAETKAVELCSVCHGPRGVSTSAEFPILAAQQRGYIELQLHAFKDKKRAEQDAHDYMWGIAGGLDDTMIKGMADYFAKQPAAPGRPGDPAVIARGKELFEKGVSDRGVPACATCHGADGKGMADFPRLASQHAKYVAKQIAFIQTLTRAAPVMHGIVKDLTQPEIDAVAAYVQSL